MQYRRRTVVVQPAHGGMACPELVDMPLKCTGQPACVEPSVDCVLNDWSTWTPCSSCTSGSHSRTRTIKTMNKGGGVPCSTLLSMSGSCSGKTEGLPQCNVPEGCAGCACRNGACDAGFTCTVSFDFFAFFLDFYHIIVIERKVWHMSIDARCGRSLRSMSK